MCFRNSSPGSGTQFTSCPALCPITNLLFTPSTLKYIDIPGRSQESQSLPIPRTVEGDENKSTKIEDGLKDGKR
jgi:hypothetical protein